MREVPNENYFNIIVNDNKYNVTVSYKRVYISHYKIELNGEYLFTISMGEEGNWRAEQDSKIASQSMVEQIGRAIEEYDVA